MKLKLIHLRFYLFAIIMARSANLESIFAPSAVRGKVGFIMCSLIQSIHFLLKIFDFLKTEYFNILLLISTPTQLPTIIKLVHVWGFGLG